MIWTEFLTFMLLKPIHQDTHTIIPQLDTTIVQRCREKRLSRMKSKPWFRDLSDNIAYCNLSKSPLTRLLFDSNFVSITDMLAAYVEQPRWVPWMKLEQC